MSRTPQQPTPTTVPEQDRLQLLTETQVSDLLAIPLQTLRNHRSQRRGIPFVRLGRAVRYKRADVLAYIDAGAVAMSATGEGNTRA
ncbi:MAG: helix-turn-helix domain-containing protein [Phycisphaerales bacterium]